MLPQNCFSVRVSSLSPGRLRNFSNRATHLLNITGFRCEVTERHDASELLLASEHWEAANLFVLHKPLRLLWALVFETKDNFRAHTIAHERFFRIARFGS